MNLIKEIYNAGIIGAGGAGFPTHIKINTQVSTLIVNAAECEPLLYKDKEILINYSDLFFQGLIAVRNHLKANQTVIGIKRKYPEIINQYNKILKSKSYNNIKVLELDDVYPAGDEVELVYEATQKIVPQGGIPLDVDCVVSNVETFYNIGNYLKNKIPVTEKYITIAGYVENPITLKVPIGISAREIIDKYAKPISDDYVMISGGAMMGYLVDKDENISKTSAGYIILPKNHILVRKKSQDITQFSKIGKSACDQCSYCTEFCPRYLLGHEIQPHRVMRTLLFSGPAKEIESRWATWCSGCSLCNLYSCPEDLQPKRVNLLIKPGNMKKLDSFKYKKDGFSVHPMRKHRRTPTTRLISRLGLTGYVKSAHLNKKIVCQTDNIILQTNQHIGNPAVPTVSVGDKIKKYQLVASVPQNKMGALIHSPVDGIVEKIENNKIIIKVS